MANTKNSITRADALMYAIERCEDNPEVVAVLQKMHASITKPRASKAGKPTQARIANEGLARAVASAANELGGDAITSAWIVDHVDGINTAQKATAVMRVAVDMGLFTKSLVPRGSRNDVYYNIAW